MVSLFVEYVRGIPVLKSFSDNKSLDEELVKRTEKFGKTSAETSKVKAKELSFYEFLLDIGYLILIISEILFLKQNKLDIFNFIIFAVISKEFYKPFTAMEEHYMYYISALDSYTRLSKILFAKVIPDNKFGLTPDKNNIIFEDVCFSYKEDEFAINNLNFEIEENTVTALVGESGSGDNAIMMIVQ